MSVPPACMSLASERTLSKAFRLTSSPALKGGVSRAKTGTVLI